MAQNLTTCHTHCDVKELKRLPICSVKKPWQYVTKQYSCSLSGFEVNAGKINRNIHELYA
jgi:hypothetical protein